MTEPSLPETLRFKEFAELREVQPSYVTALRKAGRLVLTEDGKRVRVAESIARIAATADPGRVDAVQRHAAARAAAVAPAPSAPERPDAGDDGEDEKNVNYQNARAKKEHYLALSAKRDYEVEMGKLIPVQEAAADVANIVTTLRTSLETIPDTLAPVLLGETSEARMRNLIAEEVERALGEAAQAFARYTKAGGE